LKLAATEPVAHVTHAVDAVAFEKVPGGHLRHPPAPVLKEPGRQAVQLLLLP